MSGSKGPDGIKSGNTKDLIGKFQPKAGNKLTAFSTASAPPKANTAKAAGAPPPRPTPVKASALPPKPAPVKAAAAPPKASPKPAPVKTAAIPPPKPAAAKISTPARVPARSPTKLSSQAAAAPSVTTPVKKKRQSPNSKVSFLTWWYSLTPTQRAGISLMMLVSIAVITGLSAGLASRREAEHTSSPTPTPSDAPSMHPTISTSSPTFFSTRSPTPSSTTQVDTTKYNINIEFLGDMDQRFKDIFIAAQKKWESVIVGDLPSTFTFPAGWKCFGLKLDQTQVVDDLLILATVVPIDGPSKILGQAGPCYVTQKGGKTYSRVGMMRFDIDDIERMMKYAGLAQTVIEHEMGHVLGIGTLWNDYIRISNGKIFLQSESAKRGHEEIGGTGYPPLNAGGDHWDPVTLGRELMNPYAVAKAPLSRLTVRTLEELGLVVNPNAADPFNLASGRLLQMLQSSTFSLDDDILRMGVIVGKADLTYYNPPSPTSAPGRKNLR